MDDLLLAFWGKAHPSIDTGPAWHPCVYHCLDVAAVGEALLAIRPTLLADIARDLARAEDETQRTLLFLLALHDIGKLSRPFQALAPACWTMDRLELEARPPPPLPRHGEAGLDLLDGPCHERLAPIFPDWCRDEIALLLAPFLGHHGRPVACGEINTGQIFGPHCLAAAGAMTDTMTDLFAPVPLPVVEEGRLARASWRLAGWAVLADWIGSNQGWFPYTAPELTPLAYLEQRARPRAREATAAACIAPARVATATGYRALTEDERPPSEVQVWAEAVALPKGPCLALIEDMTGGGKTEAALILAHRLMQTGHGKGVYVALPTMATANAMYDRLANVYRRLFAGDAAPNLALAHGGTRLHPGFQDSILPIDDPSRAGESGEASDVDASGAACAAWLADSRRKTFLADVGVGTIDQALIAVLPARYQSLRLFGLADRVLVVDEAHAYDAYMSKELEGLLTFHAGLGGSAIILSATLSHAIRQRLASAFAKGLGGEAPMIANQAYPLATIIGRERADEQPCAPRPDLPRRLAVSRCLDDLAAIERIREASLAGAAVAWIRNTVDDVLEGAAVLEAQGLVPSIFHARFAMGNRQDIEQACVRRFGKDGDSAGRAGILVASQVIEQSLDVDFDLVVTDLAPIDLLLQRAGRLWRHTGRERPVAGPELVVVSPDPLAATGAGWYADAFPRGRYVYRNHALSWLTATVLFDRPGWQLPEEVRALVEAVYGEDAEAGIPAPLLRSFNEAIGDDHAARGVAGSNLLRLDNGYGGEHRGWDDDTRTPTRLGEAMSTLRLAKVVDGALIPWCADPNPHRAWALSEVTVRAHRATGAPIPKPLKAAADATRSSWTRHDAEKLLVVLRQEAEGVWSGMVVDGKGEERMVAYSTCVGLRFRELSP